jgi:hypothetical protein
LKAANLPLNAAEAMAIRGFNFGIDASGFASRMDVAGAIRVGWM